MVYALLLVCGVLWTYLIKLDQKQEKYEFLFSIEMKKIFYLFGAIIFYPQIITFIFIILFIFGGMVWRLPENWIIRKSWVNELLFCFGSIYLVNGLSKSFYYSIFIKREKASFHPNIAIGFFLIILSLIL